MKDILIGFILLGSILGIGGFVMIFFSVIFGTSIAEFWLSRQGGADTAYYNMIVDGYIRSFLVAGGILFGFGLLTMVLTCYKLKLIEH
ncbi:hypothetical protein GN156_11095 [bacterium LRH843]|nr:hypothetical protein [bacterium LRH843]